MTKEQWQAIKNCDENYNGRLFYAIRNTKRVCRPSCRKKSYDPGKVVVFDSLESALKQGYRPCCRCRPELEHWEGPKKELAAAAEKLVRENYKEKFSLDALAGSLHIDKSYLLRTFKEVTGSTLLEFHNRVRCEKAKELLYRPELSISSIASQVGYVSASHFAQVFKRVEGCTPTQFRAAYLKSIDE